MSAHLYACHHRHVNGYPTAAQPRPLQGVLAIHDPRLRCAGAVVEPENCNAGSLDLIDRAAGIASNDLLGDAIHDQIEVGEKNASTEAVVRLGSTTAVRVP